MKYSGFFNRFIAAFIDSIILVSITSFFFKSQFSLNVIIMYGYQVWMIGRYGATVGKMIMKIRVVKENGGKVSYSDALLREISKILSWIVFGLGYLNIIWDIKKQGWHDKIAKTVVVMTK